MTNHHLTERHIADLHRSGLAEATIAAAGFYAFSAAEVAQSLGRDDAGSGMAIPYPDCTFSDGSPYVRVRLDIPLAISDHSVRYLTKKGERNRLYVPSLLPTSTLSDPSIRLTIVEGEKKALKACQEGIHTIGVAGVWSWRTKIEGSSVPLPDFDAIAWQGRHVAIAYDSDSMTNGSVRAAGSKLASELSTRGAQVRILALPAECEEEKVGLDDYLLSHSKEEYEDLVEATPLWQQSRHPDSEGGAERRESQADRLVALVIDSGVEMFHDQFGDAFALVPVGGHREIWPCRGKHLKRWIAGRFWQMEQKAANSEALTAALNVIEAQARFDGVEWELYNRVASYQETLWYDLGDKAWRAVRIAPDGWGVVADPPILFRRYSHQRPQPEPVRGGDLHDLRRFVNLRDDGQLLLCQVYLVYCFVPDVPHPIPDVHGGQGSAKSSLLRVLRRLGDPSAVELLSLPHDRTEFVQQLAHHWMPYYDNITDLSPWASDALCRASTGEGFSKRELYSDDDDVIYQFRRCPGLNGINVAARKPDLLERCLLIELDAIPKDKRRPEQLLWREFEEARPRLLGAVFDALSRAMELVSYVRLPELPRMADFATWGCAIAQAIGYSQDDFLAAYGCNHEIRNDEALQASPLGVMVLALMEDREEWKGTASQLLAELEKLTARHGVNTQSKDWPKAANALSRELTRVRANLAVAGIGIERGSEGTRRWVHLRKMGGETVRTVMSVTGDSGDGRAALTPDAIAVGQPQASSSEPSYDGTPGGLSAGDSGATDATDDSPRRSAEEDLRFASVRPDSDAADSGKESGHAVTAAVQTAVDDPSAWPDEAEPGPCRPCHACRGTRFWWDTLGVRHCGTCHPPAREDVVVEWLEIAGEGSGGGGG